MTFRPLGCVGFARYDDHFLAVCEHAGTFTGIRADQAATTVFTFVLGRTVERVRPRFFARSGYIRIEIPTGERPITPQVSSRS